MTATHTIVMTGASRGIGRIAAQRILEQDPGAHLVVIARGAGAKSLAADLASRRRSVSAVTAELGSLSSVRDAAAQIIADLERGALPPLRGFIGNAGTQYVNATTQTSDGFEATFAVNVLANHVLIRALEPHFEPGSRVTITASDTHFGDFAHNMGMVPGPVWQAPDRLAKTAAFPKPETTTAGRTAYSTSKLAVIYLVHEYARQLRKDIDVISYNPGFVPGTGLARNADAVSRFLMGRIMPLMTLTPMATSQADAGRFLADAALGATASQSGAYVDRSKAARSSAESYDPAREIELWDAVERLTSVR